jgi:fatty-acyl-CoA synthase
MFHAAGWALPFSTAMVGGKLVYSTDYTPEVMCQLMREEGVTHTAGVPTVWLALMQHAEATGADLGRLSTVHIGGSAAPRAMIRYFTERGIRVGHAWGMTEMSPLGTVGAATGDWDELDLEQQLDYMCKQGRVPFGVELRTVDEEGNVLAARRQDVGPAADPGPWIIRQYFQDEKGRRSIPTAGSTPATSPLLHPNGVLQITDRSKDVIKSGGEWISSIDLENAAVGCPGVAEAAAVGV